MKYSGIEWIGDMPNHWTRVKVNNLFSEIGSGTTPKGEDYYNDGTINWVQSGDINGGYLNKCSTKVNTNAIKDYSALKIYRAPYLIMAMYGGSVGHLSISNIDACCNQACCVMKNPCCDFDYAFYSLIAVKEYLLKSAIGGGQPNISQTIIKQIWFCKPSIEEQQKISKYLNEKIKQIDLLIENEKMQIEKLNEFVESYIYEFLNEELGICINNNSFESRIPMKKIGSLSNLVTKQTGFDYSNIIKPTMLDYPNDDSLPYLQTRNFKNNYFNLNTEFYVPKTTWEQFPKLILNDETLLFSIVGASIGNVAIFPKNETAFLGGAICRVNLIDKDYCLYVKEIMLSKFGQEQINRKINSNAQGTITVQNVRDFLIPMPEKEVAIKIGKKCKRIREDVENLISLKEKKIEELEEYKKSLIYEYVTGKKEVC